MPIQVYVGRFGEEKWLYRQIEPDYYPTKGDFIFYNETTYKVLYVMIDMDNYEYDVFIRETIEEDF